MGEHNLRYWGTYWSHVAKI